MSIKDVSHQSSGMQLPFVVQCSEMASRSLMGSPLTALLWSVLDCSLCCMTLLHWLQINAEALPLLAWYLSFQVTYVVTSALQRISNCFSCGIFGSPVRDESTGCGVGAENTVSILLSRASPISSPYSEVFQIWLIMKAVITELSLACLADPMA